MFLPYFPFSLWPVSGMSFPMVPAGPAAATLRVLVVDDHVDGAEALAALVEVFGHEVETCFDGNEAVARIPAMRPHLVLLDLSLPGLDGCEVARRVKADSHALLVALSGYDGDEIRQQCADAGFHHHCVKPLSAVRLQELLVLAQTHTARAG